MTRSHHLLASVLLFAVLVGATAVAGCVPVAFPMSTRIEDATRAERHLPTEAIVPGQTTRHEIEERYRAFAVESGLPSLFWGRVRRSTWGAGVVGYPTGGSRAWSVENVLVIFNADGTVKSSAVVGEKELLPYMARLTVELGVPPPDLSRTIVIEGLPEKLAGREGLPRTWTHTVDLALTGTGVAVTKYPWVVPDAGSSRRKPIPPPTIADVAMERIESIRSGGGGGQNDGNQVEIKLSFTVKTAVGNQVTVRVSPATMPTFARWLAQVGLR